MASKRIKSLSISFFLENFRIVMLGPLMASGGMIALTRDPSFRRASTMGELSSIRRPSGETMRSIAANTDASFENDISERVNTPWRSMKMSLNRLTMISVTVSSDSSASSGPKPTISFSTMSRRASRIFLIETKAGSVSINSSISFCTAVLSSASAIRDTLTRRRSMAAISFLCKRARMAIPSGCSSGLSLSRKGGVRLALCTLSLEAGPFRISCFDR